jgi:AbrB family looped-hinge helix DNA binding protein
MKSDDQIIRDETKATSQHQITIPKKIWDKLRLTPGTRLQVIFKGGDEMLVRPRREEHDLNDNEWNELTKLARSKKNITKRFKSTKKAISYLNKL